MLFRPLFFLLGVIVGVFLIYTVKPDISVIMKYPHPDNCGKLTYKDKNGICYQYASEKVKCDGGPKQVPYPLQ
jgi:hypothetical protein